MLSKFILNTFTFCLVVQLLANFCFSFCYALSPQPFLCQLFGHSTDSFWWSLHGWLGRGCDKSWVWLQVLQNLNQMSIQILHKSRRLHVSLVAYTLIDCRDGHWWASLLLIIWVWKVDRKSWILLFVPSLSTFKGDSI